MRSFVVASALIFLTLPFVAVQSAQPISARYRIAFSQDKPQQLLVEAQLPVTGGRIFMNPFGADQLPDGWATFIRDLQAVDSSEHPLQIKSLGNATWQLGNNYVGEVKLSYKVNLSFAYEKWPAGNEQAGFYQDKSLFLVTRPLFITSEHAGKRQVTFDVPAGWKISSPWQPSLNDKRTFIAQDRTDLLSNTVVLGHHAEHRFQEGPFTFVLALPGEISESADLIVSTLKKPVSAYYRVFDQTPPSIFMMTLFYADQEDGEGYSRSAALTTKDKVSPDTLILWGNTLAHELFHFWNGHQMYGEPRQEREWFSEGFTEYYANRTLVRERLISEELFIKKMEKHIAMYLYFKWAPAFTGVSIQQAGTRKSYYRPGVYQGGWTVAFCLDVLIREQSKGNKSLDDFMRSMYKQFGLTRKTYGVQDIVRTATETAGTDLSEFFKKYVSGNETIPVEQYLKKIGLNGHFKGYSGEVYISRDSDAYPTDLKRGRCLILAEC
ncbi:MAG TPA: hypothetical protein VJ023_16565 [Pyrinomonadaceae bacterium]|nr:hypothetical protein [Pyrinomonadaceae bacterium]